MRKFNFIDYEVMKYKGIDLFVEGLAIAKTQKNYIVFINKKGKEVISGKYKNALPFSEGLAAFQDENGLWGFIDKQGNQVIQPSFIDISKFKNGYSVCRKNKWDKGYVDWEGHFYSDYEWCHSFNGELTHARLKSSNDEISIIDRNLNKVGGQKTSSLDGKEICECRCGLSRFVNSAGYHGFIDINFNIKIPCIFYQARAFQEGMAIVEPTPSTIGSVTLDGKITSFSKELHYKNIKDFSCGLAAVQNKEGLWGFIDKSGKEVIPCQYLEVDNFSENLAGVRDTFGHLFYINKKGEKKLEIPISYCSVLELPSKNIYISASSPSKLAEKKHQILKLAREELMAEIEREPDDLASELESDIYRLTKNL